MSTFINPFVDRGFKILFGQEVSKDLLVDFLNDLFDGERYIADLTFLNVEMPAESAEGRGAVFDLKCKDDKGNLFIVEVQNAPQCYFHDRGLYYLCRAISNQGVKGPDWKFSLYPVYGVFFMNFKSGNTDKLRTDVILADRQTGHLFSDRMYQVYLEMPFFTKKENECTTNFDRWLYVLKNMDKLERMPFKAQKQLFEKLERIAGIANLSEKERLEYDESLKVYRDCKNIVDFAEEKGIEKGYEKGKAEGEAKGKAEGKAEGIAEGERLVASKLKEQGASPEMIVLCTGLTLEEIELL